MPKRAGFFCPDRSFSAMENYPGHRSPWFTSLNWRSAMTFFRKLVQYWSNPRPRTPTTPQARPRLEALEDRVVPAGQIFIDPNCGGCVQIIGENSTHDSVLVEYA